MSAIHIVLQGKGGVGKTLISSLIFQYLTCKGYNVFGIDTDQVNSTFKGFSQLNVTVLDIGDNFDNIDQRKFDSMIDMIESCEDEQNLIIDNGASTFIPLCSYIKENDIFSMLNEKHNVIVHSIVTGGQGISDTINGLHSLISNFNITLIVWLNRYFGEIKYEGKEFENFKIYEENKEKIAAIVKIPLKNVQTFGRDLEELFTRRQTFASAITDETLPIMTRQRLKIWWNEMCAELDRAQVI